LQPDISPGMPMKAADGVTPAESERMISKHDLQRLIERAPGEYPVLSLFLDLSVNSDNKRTHRIFLSQKRAEFDELDSDRHNHHREEIGATFARIDRWLDDEYSEENRGVVVYAEIGGDWFEAMQFPVPVQNRMVINDRPVIKPLAQVIESYHHLGVVLLDRERVRILSIYLGTLLDEIEVRGDPIPAPHGLQPGGYSQKRFQRRKDEETKHFFKEFSREVDEFVRRYQPHELVVLGTDENVARFREFLSERVRGMIVYTGAMGVDESASEIMLKIAPHLDAERVREDQEVVEMLLGRVREDYLATAGFQSTLTALQEGKVDTLVVARDLEHEGIRCGGCGFVFARSVEPCPYCGSEETTDVDAVEEMIRMAEVQGAAVEFVDPGMVTDLRGVGSLLRF
jgi:peptide chain release factor subunit 1